MLAAQVGFSVAVLFLSGLLLLSFRRLIAVDLGFAHDNVVLFDLAPRAREGRPPDSGAKLLEHLRHLPAVQGASLSRQRPIGGAWVWIMTPIIRLPGRANETVRPAESPVSEGFFRAMQVRWIAGRDFLPEEISTHCTREIGTRIALGSTRGAVVRLIVSGATMPVIAGIAAGIAAGLGLARYLAAQLFGVESADFRSLAAPVAAVLPPAIRAASADPLVALRYE